MRLDEYLVFKGYFDSRTKSKQCIERGEVYIGDKNITKPSFNIDANKTYQIQIKSEFFFVSLGGYKIQKAIIDFNLNVKDIVVADIGCSAGGFTDCLLQNGAKKVYAVDITNDVLHNSLKNDNRVKFINKNAKDLISSDFNDTLDLLVCDLSFISISSVISAFSSILSEEKYALFLIKPQFEIGEKRRFKNGIVNDKNLRKKACEEVYNIAIQHGFSPIKLTNAPINQGKNVEYLMLLKKSVGNQVSFDLLDIF